MHGLGIQLKKMSISCRTCHAVYPSLRPFMRPDSCADSCRILSCVMQITHTHRYNAKFYGLDQLDAAFVWGKNKKTYFFRYLISLYWFPAVAHLIGIAERIFIGATTTSKDKWIPDIRTICPGGGVCRPTSTRLCSGPTVIFFVIKLKNA